MAMQTIYNPFVKPYNNGWEDGELGNTPITAAILNNNYDIFLLNLNSWGLEASVLLDKVVDIIPNGPAESTAYLRKLTIDDVTYAVEGDTVIWDQIQQSGTKIASIDINGVSTDIFAPSGSGGSSVSWNQIQTSTGGTKIAEVTIDNVTTNVYAPTDTGDSVSWSEVQTTGTKIATITINGTSTDVYAPTSGGASSLSGLSDVAISSPSNGQILTYNNSTSKWGNSDIPLPYKEVTGTLSSGNTSITLSDASITTSSTIDIYTDGDVDYNSVSVSTGSVTITFDAQSSNLGVKVRVS